MDEVLPHALILDEGDVLFKEDDAAFLIKGDKSDKLEQKGEGASIN